MSISTMITKLRNTANLSQEKFADIFGVSQQSVQKWESGNSTPDLDKIIKIAKYFDVSIDSMVLDSDTRITEELQYNKRITPKYANLHEWESYSSNLLTEYRQCMEEGLDIEKYHDLFVAVSNLPKDEIKKRFGDVIFDIVMHAPQRKDHRYTEPSELTQLKMLRKPYPIEGSVCPDKLESKIHGAWMGRICGCMLGKTVEGIKTHELIPFLKETGNYPMHRYIYASDLNDEILNKYKYRFAQRAYADQIDGMPKDDDTNYVVMAQEIISTYGRDFTSYDVSNAWMNLLAKRSYCTAERVAFCNFIKGYEPPESAIYQNPYREWIGAQIRGDYFGYINPGNPELAAEMAFRDACISHVKNGIYGEMFVAAMLACAAITEDLKDIIQGGLAQIPHTSRLYEAVTELLQDHEAGVSQEDAFTKIHARYNEYVGHDWCHTISNALIVVASLLYGEGDYAKSICMSVETGFDTDCNGATVGSILGMAYGIESIPEYWQAPMHDTLHTSLFGVGTVKISDRVAITMKHIQK